MNTFIDHISNQKGIFPWVYLYQKSSERLGIETGGGPQLKAIQNEDSMQKDEDIKLTNNKHSASRSAVEQFMDLMRIFMIMKRLCQIITAIHRPLLGFKKKINDQMNEYQKSGQIRLSTDKFNCLYDFVVCLPELLTTSVTHSNSDFGRICTRRSY